MKVVDSKWLSQVIFSAVNQSGGPEWLSLTFTLTFIATYLVCFAMFRIQAKSWGVALLGVVCVAAINWSRISTIRPENFALLCFSVLLFLLVTQDAGRLRRSWKLWVGVPATMAIWANLHGSFPVGLVVLGCWWVGRTIELVWREGISLAVIRDAGFRRSLYLMELGALATLINPYGIDLWLETILFLNNANLADVLEWQTLELLGPSGRGFAVSWILLMILLRHSRQPVPVAHVLSLSVVALGAAFRVRMISWYALVFGVVAVPHMADVSNQLAKRWREGSAKVWAMAVTNRWLQPSFKYTLVAVLAVWICFVLSPSSRLMLGGDLRSPQQIYHADTPIELTEYLKSQPVSGMVWNPQYWGDWLLREGPDGMEIFANSNVHLVPHQVWLDYGRVSNAHSGWEGVLERYDIKTMIVDKKEQLPLWSIVRGDDNWELKYEDKRAALLTKVVPLSSRFQTEAARP
jgi:hypothetical protein